MSAPSSPGGVRTVQASRSVATTASAPASWAAAMAAEGSRTCARRRGVLHQHAVGLGQVGGGDVVDHVDADADGVGPGLHHGDGLRERVGGDHEARAVALGHQAGAHGHGLGGGCALVEQRRVGQLGAGEVGDHGLEVQQRLETALGDLGLVRRVGGVPGRVLEDVAADHRRRVGAVVAESDHRATHDVAVGQRPQIGQHGHFRAGRRQVERIGLADRCRHGLVDELSRGCRPPPPSACGRRRRDVARCGVGGTSWGKGSRRSPGTRRCRTAPSVPVT